MIIKLQLLHKNIFHSKKRLDQFNHIFQLTNTSFWPNPEKILLQNTIFKNFEFTFENTSFTYDLKKAA